MEKRQNGQFENRDAASQYEKKMAAQLDNPIESVLRGGQFKKLVENQLSGVKEKYGLKRIEMEILYFLTQSGMHNTAKDICRYLNMNKGHISQAVENLSEMGYLCASTDKADRRYVHYMVTERAKAVCEETTQAWNKMSRRIIADIPEEKLYVFREVAVKIVENMNEMLNEQ